MLCMQGPGRACRCTVTSRVRHAAPTTTARQDTAAQGRRTADDKNSSFLKNFFLTIFLAARPQNSFEAARMPNYLKRPRCQIIFSGPNARLFKAVRMPNYLKRSGCQIMLSSYLVQSPRVATSSARSRHQARANMVSSIFLKLNLFLKYSSELTEFTV